MMGSHKKRRGGESHRLFSFKRSPHRKANHREPQSIRLEDVEPSIYHKSFLFNWYQSQFNYMMDFAINIYRGKYVPLFCNIAGTNACISIEFFAVVCCIVVALLLYTMVRFIYHLLMSSINNIVYHTYSKNVNLIKFGVPKANYREDIQKKIFLNDSWRYDFLLNHINYVTKRYHYPMIMAVMFIFSATRRSQTFVRIDHYFGFNINDRIYTLLQIVVAVIIAYVSYLSSFGLRKDLTSFIRSLTDRNERISDTNSTIFRTYDEIMADLDIYRFSHLRTSDEDDIILSPDSYETFQVERLRELIVDGEIYNGKKFRFIEFSGTSQFNSKEEIFMRVFSYSSVVHYSPSGIFNIPVNDMRVYDTVAFLLLFVYFFTSLDLQGYFFILFGAMFMIFVLLLCFRCYHDKIYCFAFYRRNELIHLRVIPSLILKKGEHEKLNATIVDVGAGVELSESHFRLQSSLGTAFPCDRQCLQGGINPLHTVQSTNRAISNESGTEGFRTVYTASPDRRSMMQNSNNHQFDDTELGNVVGDLKVEVMSGFYGQSNPSGRISCANPNSFKSFKFREDSDVELFNGMGLTSVFKVALSCCVNREEFVYKKVEKVLNYLIIKTSSNLNYKVHETGFKISDFIRFVRDVCYHFQISALILYQDKKGHDNKIYENIRSVDLLFCKISNNGHLPDVSKKHVSSANILCESRMCNIELDMDAKEVYVKTSPPLVNSNNNDGPVSSFPQADQCVPLYYDNPANSKTGRSKIKTTTTIQDDSGSRQDEEEGIENSV
jgi:hypothetical protein